VHRTGQRPGHPPDITVRAGDDLQVHLLPAVLAGVELPVRGDPVDGDQGPDHVRVPGLLRVPDRLAQLRRPAREQGDGLAHVPPGRGDPYLKHRRELGERLALMQVDQDQVDQDQEGLLPGVQLPPRADQDPVPADDDAGHKGEGPGRQRQRGTVNSMEAPGGESGSWSTASFTRGFPVLSQGALPRGQTATNPSQPG